VRQGRTGRIVTREGQGGQPRRPSDINALWKKIDKPDTAGVNPSGRPLALARFPPTHTQPTSQKVSTLSTREEYNRLAITAIDIDVRQTLVDAGPAIRGRGLSSVVRACSGTGPPPPTHCAQRQQPQFMYTFVLFGLAGIVSRQCARI
jgi:hypothetical protein